MREWLALLFAVVVFLVIVFIERRTVSEPFVTVDLDTAVAQRQMLQFEGERRYNPLARAQHPAAQVSADKVLAAVQQTVPVPTTRTASLLELLGLSTMAAADDGTNKTGQGVEQTGVLQQKIDFCESLTKVDCTMLDDPRMAECGFCHKGGKNSKGQGWRGGMFISTDDQIRANEVSNAAGGAPAVYKPTIGTCAPENFTLMKENCAARESQLACLAAGAATSSNQCGQCFGASAGGTNGLMVVGPKPRSYPAILWVSHPGSHALDPAGNSLVVKNAAGTTVGILKYSANTLLDPQSIPVQITEGDNLTITMGGVPMVWCGWLSSTDGKRTVSLDIGAQSVTDGYGRPNSFQVAGDKRSANVTKLTGTYDTDTWTTFEAQVPNTVMWYMRTEGVPGKVTSAWYGSALPPSTNGAWVGQQVRAYIGSGKTITASPAAFAIADPAPGLTKALTIWLDNGLTVTIPDGQSFTPTQNIPQMFPLNKMTMALTVPATLVDPVFASDIKACPTGPLIFTEIGAGLMSSHSCYKPDGSFNPTQYCLQELFQAAGGTPQGTAYPNSPAAVQQLLVKDPSGNPSLDLTVQQLNNLGSVALYGTDTQGNPASWGDIKGAALAMLGVTMTNPCEGPTAKTGPHSAECLDFLWRTSGAAAPPNLSKTSLKSVPYSYCAAAGTAAPLNPDGSVRQEAVEAANSYGALPNVTAYYQSLYKRALDPSDFDTQAKAMQQCFNITLPPPVIDNTNCPPPAPTEWQCFTPANLLSMWYSPLLTPASWQADTSKPLAQIAISEAIPGFGSGQIWGIDSTNTIWFKQNWTSPWLQQRGTAVQIDARDGYHIVAVTPQSTVMYFQQGTGWVPMPGAATWVSMGADGTMWAVGNQQPAGAQQTLFQYTNGQMTAAPGAGVQIAVGNATNIWVVNAANTAYQFIENTWVFRSQNIQRVAVSTDGKVAAITTAGGLSIWTGGTTWAPVSLPSGYGGLTSVNLSSTQIAVTTTSGQILYAAFAAPDTYVTDSAVPAMREVNSVAGNQVQCVSSDGSNCHMFGSLNDCAAWVANTSTNPSLNTTAVPPAQTASLADAYFRARN
jgi:hypothetical protein